MRESGKDGERRSRGRSAGVWRPGPPYQIKLTSVTDWRSVIQLTFPLSNLGIP